MSMLKALWSFEVQKSIYITISYTNLTVREIFVILIINLQNPVLELLHW